MAHHHPYIIPAIAWPRCRSHSGRGLCGLWQSSWRLGRTIHLQTFREHLAEQNLRNRFMTLCRTLWYPLVIKSKQKKYNVSNCFWMSFLCFPTKKRNFQCQV